MCANPVDPRDWTMEHASYIYTGDILSLTFTIRSGADLPTWPTLRIAKLTGEQRIDSDYTIDNGTLLEYYVDDGTMPLPNCTLNDAKCVQVRW